MIATMPLCPFVFEWILFVQTQSLLKAGEKPVSPILKARSISPSRLEETGEGELENADSSEWRARFRKRDQPAALDLNELLEEKNEGGTKGPGEYAWDHCGDIHCNGLVWGTCRPKESCRPRH